MDLSNFDGTEIIERVKAFCGYPRVIDPEFVRHTSTHRHVEKLKGQLGLWDPQENRVFINLPEVSQRLGLDNAEAVCAYQLLHYALAPYDIKTAFTLTAEAKLGMEEGGKRSATASFEDAVAVQRLFCDVVCVTYAAKNGMLNQMISLYKAMDRKLDGARTDVWNFLLCSLDAMWEGEYIVDWEVDGSIRSDGEDFALKMLEKPFCASAWLSAIRIFAAYLEKYSESPQQMDDSRLMDNGIDDLRERDPEEALRNISQNMGMQDFKELVGGLLGGSEEEALVWFYRDLARDYEVILSPIKSEAGEEIPDYPKSWGVGDPFFKLDIPYTLFTSGRLVPALTTKQWQKSQMDVIRKRDTPPDVIIILDGSGSMTNPSEETSNAVLSGFVMARSAANQGAKVGLIVYSCESNIIAVDPTWNVRAVENAMVKYFGGGTVFPVRPFNRISCLEMHRPKHFCLISDTEITNIMQASHYMKNALLVNPENTGSIFLINQEKNPNAEILKEAGCEVYPISKGEDILGIVAGKAEEIYA